MLFNKNPNQYTFLMQDLIDSLKKGKYKESTAFYSSNRKTDFQPENFQPHTYFGSPAITCSLYIEFFNLYSEHNI